MLVRNFDNLKCGNVIIPNILILESINRECSAAINNNEMYWDHFKLNIQHSKVLRAHIEKR